jgi:hypothetical protein
MHMPSTCPPAPHRAGPPYSWRPASLLLATRDRSRSATDPSYGQGKVPTFAPCNRPTGTRTPTVLFALHELIRTILHHPPSSFHLHPQPSWPKAGVRGLWAHALRRAGHRLDLFRKQCPRRQFIIARAATLLAKPLRRHRGSECRLH